MKLGELNSEILNSLSLGDEEHEEVSLSEEKHEEEKKESAESVASFNGSGTSTTKVAVRKFMLGDSVFNNDLFWEIGSAASIECRLKMKRLSSEWREFIESSNFASPTWIVVSPLKEGLCCMFDEDLANVGNSKFRPFTLPVGCAGGLLLMKGMESVGNSLKRAYAFSRIYIWNPFMQLFVEVITPQAAKREPATVSYGFGFGEDYGYKIVQLSQKEGKTMCWVYSTPFEDWRVVESEILNQDGEIDLTEYAVCVDDTLFWAIYPEAGDVSPKPWIWAYNLSQDSLTKIEIPSSAEQFYHTNFLGVIKNRLTYTNCDRSFRTEAEAVDIWLLEEMKWEKHYTIRTWFGDGATIYKAVHLLNNGNLAILTEETQYGDSGFDYHLISYNPEDESYEIVASFVSRTEAVVMVPNILPLDKIDGIKDAGTFWLGWTYGESQPSAS